jgi:hypothetical protein
MRASLLLALSALAAASVAAQEASPAARMREAARAFLDSLSDELRPEAALPFNDEARLDWHYFPRERPGLSMKKMSAEQREKALALVRAGLSAQGFEKTETIRALDQVLHELQGGNARRDPELYDVAVFGEPSENEPWGLRYEGHHLSINWTLAGEQVVASTPQFMGAHPAEVEAGPMKGTRALAAEEDLARALLNALNDEQRANAVLDAKAPPEILTGAEREAAIQEDRGIAYGDLDASQQGLLLSLIQEYAGAMPEEVARERIEKLRAAGLDKVKFAWMGGLEKGQGHYYRVQGPTFLIEYDNTQDDANHIHTVWRDFKGDFGLDVLKEHYRQHADATHPGEHRH